jgi:FAD:protein FMN transferase
MNDISRVMRVMGGRMDVVAYDIQEDKANPLFEGLHDEALRLQDIFNLYDKKSEISLLNRERTLEVSDELSEVILSSLRYSRETQGAYDITWGRKTMARKGIRPLPQVTCSYQDVKVEGNTVTISHHDALLDLGSIAKGYIVDRLVDWMLYNGVDAGLINARGDLRAFGEGLELIRIQHPRDMERTFKPFAVGNMGVATSGDYMQYWGSYENSHIIGGGDFSSVTVAAPLAADADALASCVFLLGRDGANEFMKAHPESKALCIDKTLAEHSYNGFKALELPEAQNGC